jgi:hypothetical protein
MARFKNLLTETQTVTQLVAPAGGTAITLDYLQVFSAQCVIDVNTPAAKTFTNTDVNITDDKITITNHGFVTGLVGQLSTTGSLPAPLVVLTDYYIIKVDANTIKLASSYNNAIAGTAINLTNTGGVGDTQTFTPTALAGASVVLQKSNNNSDWENEGSPTSITGDAVVWLEKADYPPAARYYRVYFDLDSGSLSASIYLTGKGSD